MINLYKKEVMKSSPILQPIREKVETGQRLSLDDGVLMYRGDVPLSELGAHL